MALPNVSVQIQNGGLGRVAVPDDRVCGIIFNAPGYPGLSLNTPKQIFSPDDLVDIIPADSTYGGEIRRQVADFYLAAGVGAELWIMLTFVATSTADLFSTTNYAASLLDAANGRINVLATSRYRAATESAITILDGLDADVLNGMDEAHALAVSYATRQMPLRIILDGRNLTGDPAGLRDLTTHTFNRVAINVGSNRAGAVNAAQGLLLGRIAASAPNINIGRVKDGSVPSSYGGFTSGDTIKAYGQRINSVHAKGYILLRQFVGKSGFYWNDDHMVTGATDDYSSLANGRVIDKAARIAYATFLDELLDTVQVDPTTGRIAVTTVKNYQSKIERAIGLGMAADGEISGVEAFIDPAQDILATSTLVVNLNIIPTGTNRVIVVKLGLSNPNAA